MTFDIVIFLAFHLLAMASALAAVIFVLWGFVSQRGELRTRRFRIGRLCGFVFVAAALSAVSMFFYYRGPAIMQALKPDFQIPYGWFSKLLPVIGPVAIFSSIGLVASALRRSRGTRSGLMMGAIGCFFVFAGMNVASYMLLHEVQVPAFQRHMFIEDRHWDTRVGDPAPDITVVMLDGSQVRLSDYRGKVVLLNFFATWCGPCQNELPHLEDLWKELKSNDAFQMMVVGREETQEAAAAFKSKYGYSFPVAVDANAEGFHKFAKEGIPRTYVLSRDGAILFQTIGFGDMDVYKREFERMRRTVEKELAARP